MSSNLQTYEVKVLVKKKGSMHFSTHVGRHIAESMTRMFHIEAKTHDQAGKRAEKYGRTLSVRKADVERISGNIEHLVLTEVYGADNPYPNAIAMDEMIWKKKNKRAERIKSRVKSTPEA